MKSIKTQLDFNPNDMGSMLAHYERPTSPIAATLPSFNSQKPLERRRGLHLKPSSGEAMNPCSIRNLSLYARRLPVRSPSSTPLPSVAAPASNRCKLRHLSTEFDSVDKLSSKPARSQDRDVAADGDDVTEEGKKRYFIYLYAIILLKPIFM